MSVALGVLSLALIAHLSHETGVAVHVVSNGLEATIGEQHVVGALGVVAVAGLLCTEVGAAVVVLHNVLTVVLGRDLRG